MSAESSSNGGGFAFPDSLLVEFNYMEETSELLRNNSTISIENALKINQQMQNFLYELVKDLEQMQDTCRKKYQHNIKKMEQLNRRNHQKAVLPMKTVYFCGYPFFKNRQGNGPPLSHSFMRRRAGGELFPMELLEKRSTWLHCDKIQLVQGIKKQALTYLQSFFRDQMRHARSKRNSADLIIRLKSESDGLDQLRLKDLLTRSECMNFSINWLCISMDSLDQRHTPNECSAMWQSYLMPSINRQPWQSDEEDKLLNVVGELGAQNWPQIAQRLDQRSAYQCFVHYQTTYGCKQCVKNVPWTPDEDTKLLQCIEKFRIGTIIPWTKITAMMGSRVRNQVYNRYMFTLHPKIDHKPFTSDEDCILMAAVEERGTNFRDFPSDLLPGRNIRQIRCRYNNVLKHVGKRGHWNQDHDTKLMQLVDELGPSNWTEVSNRIIYHSRTSCRQRYTTITRYLTKHPNATIADVPRRKKAFSTNVTSENWMETLLDNQAGTENPTENTKLALQAVNKVKLPTKPRKPALILKSNERALYEYFKYAYNFEFGRRIYAGDGLIENIQIASMLLHAPMVPLRLDVNAQYFSDYVTLNKGTGKFLMEPDLQTKLKQLSQGDFRFPVNMNTLLGLRGLTIAFEGDKDKARPKIKQERSNGNEEPKHEALQLFEKRFRSLFANTAAIAKLTDFFDDTNVKLRNRKRKQPPTSTVTSKVLVQSYTEPSTSTGLNAGASTSQGNQQINETSEAGEVPNEYSHGEGTLSTNEPPAVNYPASSDYFIIEPLDNPYQYEIVQVNSGGGDGGVDDGSGEPKYTIQVVVGQPMNGNNEDKQTNVTKMEP